MPKNVSTIEEIRARRGPVIAVTHPVELPVTVQAVMSVPKSEPELDPILLNIPLQLLAYCKNRSKPAPDFGRKRHLISAESGT